MITAQLNGTVEYNGCISEEVKDLPQWVSQI